MPLKTHSSKWKTSELNVQEEALDLIGQFIENQARVVANITEREYDSVYSTLMRALHIEETTRRRTTWNQYEFEFKARMAKINGVCPFVHSLI